MLRGSAFAGDQEFAHSFSFVISQGLLLFYGLNLNGTTLIDLASIRKDCCWLFLAGRRQRPLRASFIRRRPTSKAAGAVSLTACYPCTSHASNRSVLDRRFELILCHIDEADVFDWGDAVRADRRSRIEALAQSLGFKVRRAADARARRCSCASLASSAAPLATDRCPGGCECRA